MNQRDPLRIEGKLHMTVAPLQCVHHHFRLAGQDHSVLGTVKNPYRNICKIADVLRDLIALGYIAARDGYQSSKPLRISQGQTLLAGKVQMEGV